MFPNLGFDRRPVELDNVFPKTHVNSVMTRTRPASGLAI